MEVIQHILWIAPKGTWWGHKLVHGMQQNNCDTSYLSMQICNPESIRRCNTSLLFKIHNKNLYMPCAWMLKLIMMISKLLPENKYSCVYKFHSGSSTVYKLYWGYQWAHISIFLKSNQAQLWLIWCQKWDVKTTA